MKNVIQKWTIETTKSIPNIPTIISSLKTLNGYACSTLTKKKKTTFTSSGTILNLSKN